MSAPGGGSGAGRGGARGEEEEGGGGGGWRAVIAREWQARRAADAPHQKLFPLAANPFGEEEILAMTEVLLSGQLTLGENVEAAEREFAAAVGARYAVMVNSGSSANLLMVAAAVNPQRAVHCAPGDEVLVPSVCWSTSVAPLLQSGLVPVFVDASPVTFNIDVDELERVLKAHPRARALMAVHVLGNSTDMRALMEAVERHKLILLEDTCESLGSTALSADAAGVATAKAALAAAGSFGGDDDDDDDDDDDVGAAAAAAAAAATGTALAGDGSLATATASGRQMLGTFGDFGSFSFYFSHHITSGEGGMVACKTEEDYNFLRCLRAHGWTRHLTNRAEVEAQYAEIDPRFLFVNVGFNLRPMEVQGAMLRVQIKKLAAFNSCRRDNLARIEAALSADPRFAKRMRLMQAAPGTDPAWFGVGAVLHARFAHQQRAFLAYLAEHGVENRPVISGNFVRQPLIKSFLPGVRPEDFPGAEVLHSRGFFIGVHQVPVSDADVAQLVDVMLSFPFVEERVVLVTGSNGILGRHVLAEIEKHAAAAADNDDDGDDAAAAAATGGGGGAAAAAAAAAVHAGGGAARPKSAAAAAAAAAGPGAARVLTTVGDLVSATGGAAVADGEAAAADSAAPRRKTQWVFATRADADLAEPKEVASLFARFQPTDVLHLAASLQSLNEMTARPVDFWLDNVTINNNVLAAAAQYQSVSGPTKVVSVLSTVMFSRDAAFPVGAEAAVQGAMHPAGESYALAKRALAQLSRWYRTQHGASFSTVLPGNFFGAHGDFAPATAPLLNALIAKAEAARLAEAAVPLSVMGTGKPERQVMHASDLARIMIWALDHLDQELPLIVAGEELSIRAIAERVCEATGFTGGVAFDPDAVDGPLKRTADTSRFEDLCPDFKFTPLVDGLRATVDWYRQHQQQLTEVKKEEQ